MKITPKKFRVYFGLMLVASVIAVSLMNFAPAALHGFKAPITVAYKTGESGNNYRFFNKNTAVVAFTTERPSKQDRSVLVSMPAAFTIGADNNVEGVYGLNGNLHNADAVSARVGGLVVIHPDGHTSIESTKMGKALNKKYLKQYQRDGYSFFQQIKIVADGEAPGFKDDSKFQRRALVLDKEGALAMVESTAALTLTDFANDLVKLGVWNAAYTDMGAWDEGWYRDAHGAPVTLGKDLSQTARQSNWVVFKAP